MQNLIDGKIYKVVARGIGADQTEVVVNLRYKEFSEFFEGWIEPVTGESINMVITKVLEEVEEVAEEAPALQAFKQNLAKRSKPIDTTTLQTFSLIRFAKAMGYSPKRTLNINCIYGTSGFQLIKKTKGMPYNISFRDMVKLHNTVNYFQKSGVVTYLETVFDFTEDMIDKCLEAADSALVVEVKMQKAKGVIKIQDHYVSLVNK